MKYMKIILKYHHIKKSVKDKEKYARAFKVQYDEQDPYRGKAIIQRHGDKYLVQNKPETPLNREELDAVYALPYAKDYHPMYEDYGWNTSYRRS